MNNLLRIILLCLLTLIFGVSVYAVIYSPRLFKVVAFIFMILSTFIIYGMVKQWLGTKPDKKANGFTEAEIIDEEKP